VEDHTLVSFFLESGEWIAHSHLCLLSVSVVELDSGQTHVLSLHAAFVLFNKFSCCPVPVPLCKAMQHEG